MSTYLLCSRYFLFTASQPSEVLGFRCVKGSTNQSSPHWEMSVFLSGAQGENVGVGVVYSRLNASYVSTFASALLILMLNSMTQVLTELIIMSVSERPTL